MVKECLLDLRRTNLPVPFMSKIVNYLVENFDDDQLMHLLKVGVKIDQDHMMLQFNAGVGWRCLNEDYAYVGIKPICRVIEKSLNDSLLTQRRSGSTWFLPTLINEVYELEQRAKELGIRSQVMLKAVAESIMKGALSELDDKEWDSMDNTDSCYMLTVEQARTISKKCDAIMEDMSYNRPMEAPIVLYREGKAPYLLTGNTRLIVSKLLKNRPNVLKVYIK